MISRDIPFVVATTKVDKLSKTQLANALAELRSNYFENTDIEIIPFSSVTREGKETLLKKIGESAFQNCKKLKLDNKNLSLLDKLEEIGDCAFWHSGIDEIALNSVKK